MHMKQPHKIALALLACFWTAFPIFAALSSEGADPSGQSQIHLNEAEKKWLAEGHTVRARVANAPPYHFWQEGPQGISVDILNHVAATLGVKVEYIHGMPWADALDNIKRRQAVDLLLTAKRTKPREAFLSFTTNYLDLPWVIFSRRDERGLTQVDDLAGRVVAVEKAYVMHDLLQKQFPEIRVKAFKGTVQALKAVSTGQVDAYLGNLVIANWHIGQQGFTNLKVAAPVSDMGSHTQAMAVRNDWPELASILSKAIPAISAKERTAIRNHYMSLRYEYGIDWQLIWTSAAVIFLIAGGVIALVLRSNRQLAAEVKQRISSEEALRKSEERFRTFFEKSSSVMLLIDPESGNIIAGNESAADYYGYSQDRLTAMNIGDINTLPPERIAEERQKALHEERNYFNFRHCLSSGEVRDVEVYSNPILNLEKPELISIIHDISERKQAEEKLRESENRFRTLYENAPFAYQSLNEEGHLLAVNKPWLNILGYSEDEVINRWFGDFLPPAFCQLFEDRFPKFKELGETHDIEFEILRKDGETVHVSFNGRVTYDNAGNFQQTHCLLTDISESKRLEEQIRQSQKLEAVGTLAGGIAHDFNNILAIILGNAELAQLGVNDGKTIDNILEASQRGRELVQQLLTIGHRSQTEKKRLDPEPMLDETLKLMRSTLPSTIEMQLAIEGRGKKTFVDPTQLHQVLVNLLTNAGQAMGEEGGVLGVSLKPVALADNEAAMLEIPPGDYLQLTVRDTGPGIAPEVRDRIFEPFFTTKKKSLGNGLGLAVIHGVVRESGGAVQVESSLGNGATFRVFLPIVETPGEALPSTDEKATLEKGSGRVLFVDDEPSLVEVGVQMLEALGYQAAGFVDANDALTTFQETPDAFDAVITDQVMPKLAGNALAARIMAIRPEIPIFLCTGFSERMTEESAAEAGFRGYFLKPVSMGDFSKALKKALG